MRDPETTTVFAGLGGRTGTELPEWYAEQHGSPEPVSFSEAIRSLPQAVDTAVAYRNPYTDEWIETERFSALVEPSRLQAEADGDTEAEFAEKIRNLE
jgi:DNA repair exonuclease SbcCD nuclease subunit